MKHLLSQEVTYVSKAGWTGHAFLCADMPISQLGCNAHSRLTYSCSNGLIRVVRGAARPVFSRWAPGLRQHTYKHSPRGLLCGYKHSPCC